MSRGVFRGSGWLRACVTGVSCFPASCHVCGDGRAGQGPGGARPRSGAGGVLEVTGRQPDDRAAGNGSRGPCGCIRLFGSVPCPGSSGAGSAAGCSHPFACPGRGRGAWGGSASGEAVRRGQSRGARAAGDRGGAERPATSRLAAGQGGLSCRLRLRARAVSRRGSGTGSGSGRRACRRRPG